jgi:hypothetical protein
LTFDDHARPPAGGEQNDSSESLQKFAHSIQEKAGTPPPFPKTAARADEPHAEPGRSFTLARTMIEDRSTLLLMVIAAGTGTLVGFAIGWISGQRSG